VRISSLASPVDSERGER